MKKNQVISDIIKFIIIFIIVTIFAYALEDYGFRRENILLIYVLGILIIGIETKKFLYGFISAFLFALVFNFLFTEPKYTLIIDDPNYIFSLIIFIIVSIIVNTLTTRLHIQVESSKINEQRVNKLYYISSGLLNVHDPKEIILYGKECLEKILKRKIYALLNYEETSIYLGDDIEFVIQNNKQYIDWCKNNNNVCGYMEQTYSTVRYKFYPLKFKDKSIGVLIIHLENSDLKNDEKDFVNAVLSQITIALERSFSSILEQKASIKFENEKFRSALLRSISHDLRTPLTGISGGTGFLIDNFKNLDDETIKTLLSDIYNESNWLSNFVENLLNLTRIGSNSLKLNKKNEVIDDVLGEALSRIFKYKGEHTIEVQNTMDTMLVPMDSKLIVQVLVNLIENAIKHTSINAKIIISIRRTNNMCEFEISDNGGGINELLLNRLFNDYISSASNKNDSRRGFGIGLSISKSIIEAHDGKISAFNNKIGGATFIFTIPIE